MGGHVPPHAKIVKGPVPYALDLVSTGQGARARLQTLHDALQAIGPSYKGLTETLDENLLKYVFSEPTRQSVVDNLNMCWFEPKSRGAYFPGVPVAKIYAQGVIQTLEMALATNSVTPIDAWWLLGASEVSMVNLQKRGNVTLLIQTPRPKARKGVVAAKTWILGDSQAFITHVVGKKVKTIREGGAVRKKRLKGR